MTLRPPSSTLFPYTTLFRSWRPYCLPELPGASESGLLLPLLSLPHEPASRQRPGHEPRVIPQWSKCGPGGWPHSSAPRSEEHTSELQSRPHLVCRLLLEKKK